MLAMAGQMPNDWTEWAELYIYLIVYLLAMAGQMTGPNGLKFFGGNP